MMLSPRYIVFTLNVCLYASARLDPSQADFQSIYNFLAELRNNSDTMLEYVAEVQAIFCPDQPICDRTGIRERNEVLTTIPEDIKAGNKTIWIKDVPNLVKVCCLPCSCSNTCYEKCNFCPTRYYLTTDSDLRRAITECIPATAKGYNRRLSQAKTYTRYFMVTKCYEDRSDMVILSKCETPNSRSRNDTGPVTSVETERTYWNVHCAVCNNDADTLVEWTTAVEFESDLVFTANASDFTRYPRTFEELHAYLYWLGNIIYKPPSNISVENLQCIDKDSALSCPNNHGEEKSSLFVDLCRQFYNPVVAWENSKYFPYMNIFCYFCRKNRLHLHTQEDADCDWLEYSRVGPREMTALLDYRTGGKADSTKLNKPMDEATRQDCSCSQFYDNNQDLCRPVFCPLGEFLKECVQPLKNLAGMPIVLKLKITPVGQFSDSRRQTESIPSSSEKKLLKTIVEQITSKIMATFKQEKGEEQYYLCVVVIRSNKGQDTKETIKPFMKYLDSTKHLEFKSNKVMYVVRLISTALFWTETDTERRKNFKAKDLRNYNHTLIPIYSNEELKGSAVGRGYFQLLSPLLYRMQVELSEKEFIEKEGLVIVDRTSTKISTPYYYRITSQGNIRICADNFFETSGRELITSSHTLSVFSAVVQFFS